ncbi:hypothetical protein APICC_07509 [Apis cerana cerana]|uniref:Uncharacterized protein n=1 Tax=Apis cerana cerana TaxID=94128 RepID=A0A2A3DZU5_APICC|nr:hypothetical protein APICC_07509 [Apis cerana cerana]
MTAEESDRDGKADTEASQQGRSAGDHNTGPNSDSECKVQDHAPFSSPRPDTSAASRPSPLLRANPYSEVMDPICRLPLLTLIYRLKALYLRDLLRIWVRRDTSTWLSPGFLRSEGKIRTPPQLRWRVVLPKAIASPTRMHSQVTRRRDPPEIHTSLISSMSKCPIQDGCSLTSQDKRILRNTTFLSDAAEFSAELILIRTPLLKKSLSNIRRVRKQYLNNSTRHGPEIVSVNCNVRSKCQCSCILQFTRNGQGYPDTESFFVFQTVIQLEKNDSLKHGRRAHTLKKIRC